MNPVKIIKPGDQEFDEIASTITPIERIRKCISHIKGTRLKEQTYYTFLIPKEKQRKRK